MTVRRTASCTTGSALPLFRLLAHCVTLSNPSRLNSRPPSTHTQTAPDRPGRGLTNSRTQKTYGSEHRSDPRPSGTLQGVLVGEYPAQGGTCVASFAGRGARTADRPEGRR